MSEDAVLEQLNTVKYLYLQQLSEPKDNSLRIVLDEAIDLRSEPTVPGLTGYWPIESTPRCKTFELYWKCYAAYLVTEELVGSNAAGGYEDEVFTGNLLRLYSKSHFLDHLTRDTGGHTDPLQHYKVICLNHLIDVAAYAPPEIRVIAAGPRERGSS
jgi:hypothetical protein